MIPATVNHAEKVYDMNVSSVRWVWFDLDDTLIDFHTNSRAANRIIFELFKLSRFYPDPESWIKAYESHNKSLWERYSKGEITQNFLRADRFATPLRPRWNNSEEKLIELSWQMDDSYLSHLAEQTAMIDGATELLHFLRAHAYNIGVLSNGFKDVQYRKLAATGLDSLVDITVLSDDIGVNKPDRRLYIHAMERSGEPDTACHLMIGDNPSTDIAGALGVGWKTILLDPSAEALTQSSETLVTPRLNLLKALFFKPCGE